MSKKHGTFEEALKAGMNKEDAKVFAEKHYNDDEDIKTQAQKDFIAKKSADAEKLRKDFVGKRVIKNQLLKIDNNGYNKFSTSEITADGYSRTESPVEIRKYKDITDENKKPVSLSYTSYVYNLEDAGIEFSNVNYSGYKNTYKHGAKISYAGYPTKSDALKDLSGTAQYNGRAFVVSSYYGDKDLDDAKVSLTADFNKKKSVVKSPTILIILLSQKFN
ncbi:hypothetical protein HPC37_10610 [Pasteurellaceae bacterium 20609_3]|uniref:hypothetical protein n=1 Tax=Spirabiliibacterium mucosae TaxID=28156 RepID=UPI001AAD58C2|nr:hypothetical protein [Spirabiliibacterium mucosae]MBE2899199.1 hypothetical protein [Spirabiliibacterium mucosae]